MQVKPRFENYKILEQHPILKDDTGNEMHLTLMEVKLPSNDNEIIETPYRFWSVIGRTQYQHTNKAVAYEDVAFWKAEKRDLFIGTVNGFIVEEVEAGVHFVFDEGNYFNEFKKTKEGLRTTFKIRKV